MNDTVANNDVGTIRSTSGTGFIRMLKANEQHLLREHLLRLEPASRHDRFNGGISEDFVKSYAARCFEDGTIVIGYIQDGVVRGAAELHAPQRSAEAVPEIAFSVENRVRRQGVGSALFDQLLMEARRKGYENLRITTGGQNQAMKALAKKFGARLTFRQGEATGIIDLEYDEHSDAAHSVLREQPGNPSATLAREMIRGSQALWDLSFRLYADLLDRGHRLGMH